MTKMEKILAMVLMFVTILLVSFNFLYVKAVDLNLTENTSSSTNSSDDEDDDNSTSSASNSSSTNSSSLSSSATVKTTSSTYTSNNLKYQIYDSSYNAITDVMTLSKTSDELVYFKKNSVQFSLASSGTNVYNLVIWLSDTNSEQSADYSKSFSGKIGFELVGASSEIIEASF